MGLYVCEKCGCIENTALGFYWSRNVVTMNWPDEYKNKALCSECGPTTYSDGTPTNYGKWHDRFPKRSADGMFVDDLGYLWSKENIDNKQIPLHRTIIGVIVVRTICDRLCIHIDTLKKEPVKCSNMLNR